MTTMGVQAVIPELGTPLSSRIALEAQLPVQQRQLPSDHLLEAVEQQQLTSESAIGFQDKFAAGKEAETAPSQQEGLTGPR